MNTVNRNCCVFFVQLSVAFYTLLVRYLTGNGGTDSGPVIVSVVSLTLASLPSGLMPIDALLVGYMKNSSGLFEPWASDLRVRQDVSSVLLCSYYGTWPAVVLIVAYSNYNSNLLFKQLVISLFWCASSSPFR